MKITPLPITEADLELVLTQSISGNSISCSLRAKENKGFDDDLLRSQMQERENIDNCIIKLGNPDAIMLDDEERRIGYWRFIEEVSQLEIIVDSDLWHPDDATKGTMIWFRIFTNGQRTVDIDSKFLRVWESFIKYLNELKAL